MSEPSPAFFALVRRRGRRRRRRKVYSRLTQEVGASLESACPLHVTIVVKLVFGCAHVYNVCMVNSNACDDDDEQGHHLRAALIPPSFQHSFPPPVGDSSPCFLHPFVVQHNTTA